MMAFRALLDRPADLAQGLRLASGIVFICMLFAGSARFGRGSHDHITWCPAIR
jgi:hypothetical protein